MDTINEELTTDEDGPRTPRPGLPPNLQRMAKQTVIISAHVTPQIADLLRAEAKALGLSVSRTAELAIATFVRR